MLRFINTNWLSERLTCKNKYTSQHTHTLPVDTNACSAVGIKRPFAAVSFFRFRSNANGPLGWMLSAPHLRVCHTFVYWKFNSNRVFEKLTDWFGFTAQGQREWKQ